MKNSESRKLTNLLKKAQKMTWWGTDMSKCTLGFAYNHPRYIDWQMTGSVAGKLYDEILATIDALPEDARLTARQRDLLELHRDLVAR